MLSLVEHEKKFYKLEARCVYVTGMILDSRYCFGMAFEAKVKVEIFKFWFYGL